MIGTIIEYYISAYGTRYAVCKYSLYFLPPPSPRLFLPASLLISRVRILEALKGVV